MMIIIICWWSSSSEFLCCFLVYLYTIYNEFSVSDEEIKWSLFQASHIVFSWFQDMKLLPFISKFIILQLHLFIAFLSYTIKILCILLRCFFCLENTLSKFYNQVISQCLLELEYKGSYRKFYGWLDILQN